MKASYEPWGGSPDPNLGAVPGAREYRIRSERIDLHAVEAGNPSAPVMLFVHGFPEFWFSWRHQLKSFAADYRCVAIDLRGYHRSARPSGNHPYVMEELLADLDDVIQALGVEDVTLVAHDWGGAIAWIYAAERPRKVKRLVIGNMPHPANFQRGLLTLKQLRRSWYIFFFQLPRIPEWMLTRNRARAVGGMFRGMLIDRSAMSREEIAAFREAALEPGAIQAMLAYYRSIFQWKNLTRTHPLIRVPTLILWGEEDQALGMELLEGTERYAPRVEIHRIPACSHWVQQEKPAEFNEALASWLKRNP